MATITLSTNGWGKPAGQNFLGLEDLQQCHRVDDIELTRYFGDNERNVAVIHIDTDDAFALAHDLLAQAKREATA